MGMVIYRYMCCTHPIESPCLLVKEPIKIHEQSVDLPSENPKRRGGVMEDIFAVAQPMNTSWPLSFGFIWYDRLHICTRC